jgi:hypothetical protein
VVESAKDVLDGARVSRIVVGERCGLKSVQTWQAAWLERDLLEANLQDISRAVE